MELILLTDYRGALRQRQQVFQSLDVDRVRDVLSRRGVDTRLAGFEEVANGAVALTGRTIHYTSTQDPGYRAFVDDVLFTLARHNRLVPRYEIFRAHENKGFQELLKRELGLTGLDWSYFGNLAGATAGTTEFPRVLKAAAGYQGQTVHLVDDARELAARLRRMNRPAGWLNYRLKQWLKQHVLKGRYHAEMYEDCVHSGPVVLQEFVPGAPGDWKVLVFGERLYVLRRLTRQGDFRASGSGRFAFQVPPTEVLDFARAVFAKLDLPMASLDILHHDDRCHLLEFQGLHFGSYTLDEAPHHFRHRNNAWEQQPKDRTLEDEYAHSLADYLDRPAATADEPLLPGDG